MAVNFPIVVSVTPDPSGVAAVDKGTAHLQASATRLGESMAKASRLNVPGFQRDAGVVKQGLSDIERQARRTEAAVKALARGQAAPRPTDLGSFSKDLQAKLAVDRRKELDGLIDGFNKTAVASSKAKAGVGGFGGAAQVATTKAGSLATVLRGAAWAYAAVQVVKLGAAVVRLSDQYTSLQNRLRTVTKDSRELGEMTERLFRVSQESRTSWQATTELYVRTYNATKQLGVSQRQVIEFTETLSKAMATSGASAEEARNAMIQLSQGLNSGVLRGDELRSVLEQLPDVADIIARSLGTTRDQIKKLGEEGKITSGVVLRAFAEARGEISGRFAKAVPTAAQAFQRLRDSIMRSIGEISGAIGPFANKLADAIADLADKAKPLLSILGRVAGVVVRIVSSGLVRFFENMLGLLEPILLLLEPIVFALEKIADLSEIIPDLGDLKAAYRSYIGNADLAGTASQAKAQEESLDRIRKAELEVSKATDERVEATKEVIEASMDTLKAYERLIEDAIKKEEERKKKAEAALKALRAEFLAAYEAANPLAAAQNELGRTQDLVNRIVAKYPELEEAALEVMERKRAELADQLDPLGAVQRALAEEIEILGLSSDAREREIWLREQETALRAAGLAVSGAEIESLGDLYDQRAALIRLNEQEEAAEARKAAIYNEITGPAREYALNLAALNALKEEGAITTSQYVAAMERLQASMGEVELPTDQFRSFEGGVIDGFKQIQTSILDTASIVEGAITSSFSAMEGALGDFVTGTRVDFKRLVDDLLRDLTKLLFRLLLIQGLKAALGGGGDSMLGSVLTKTGGALGFAEGGSAIVGGRPGRDQNLALLRVSRGERVDVSTRLQQRQERRAAATVAAPVAAPAVNLQVVSDPRDVVHGINTPMGERAVVEVIRRNASAIRSYIGTS